MICVCSCLVLFSCSPSTSNPPIDSGSPDAGDSDVGPADADEVVDTGHDGDVEEDSDIPSEFTGICEACEDHEECGPLARCIELTTGERVCAATCVPDIPTCPRAFDCIHNFMAPDHTVCVPIGESCCIDEDADGYGVGVGCRGPDCNDSATDINPGVDEHCNGRDDDCDEIVDEEVVDCGLQQCQDVGTEGYYEETEPGECIAAECTEGVSSSCGLYTCGRGEELRDRCAASCLAEGDEDDTLCIVIAHCDLGLCIEDFPNGEVCDEDSDCESEHCDNGFCCDDGTCCYELDDCPGSGTVTTTCDNSSTCQGTRGEAACTDFQCTTEEGIPDDSACDADVEADTCGFFLSIFCTGEEDQDVPRCPATCDDDDGCDDSAHCDTVCLPDLPDGDPCNEDTDCITGYCDNNICCEAGDCCRDPDDCPTDYSTDPVCDSPSSCQGTRDAATCSDYICATQTNVENDSACTSSTLADDCGTYPSRYCSGVEDQTEPLCATSCSSDAECDDNAHCDLNLCVPDLPNGEACNEPSDCVSGHCQNGFCCSFGDCCAIDTDCPAADYGEPSVCLGASTCQGERRDPSCNVLFQCQQGDLVDDDSGCLGLTSNDCGPYLSVLCTSDETQPPDQAALCDTICTNDLDCDPGAHCSVGGACVTDGEPGDPCSLTTECEAGLQCVDGVCCSDTCPGVCRACDVPGHEGDCWDVPDGTDMDDECDGFDCNDYYHSWSSDYCYDRSDAPDSAVDCDGTGQCEDPADVCPDRARGSIRTTCHADCQEPNGTTCTGMTIGTCNNVNPGDQTCGDGVCEITVPQCSGGAPFDCVPPTGTAEVCNDLDDDCDTFIDDNLAGDAFENNDSCTLYENLGTIYSSGVEGEPATITVTPTLYPSGDIDVFTVYFQENDTDCGCSWSTDEDYAVTAEITVPPGAGSYEVCLRQSGTCGEGTCETVVANSTGSVQVWFDGCCSPIGCSDSARYWIHVQPVGAPGFECETYTLALTTQRGCR